MSKFKRNLITLFIAAVFLFFMNCNDSPDHSLPEEKEAHNAAMTWLNMIDEGHYNESWQMTSTSLKNRITERQWRIGLEQIRAPMGKVKTRKVISIKMAESVPNGNQQKKNIVVQFSTIFGDQNSVIEFVTLQIEDNHEWLVSAYYIDR